MRKNKTEKWFDKYGKAKIIETWYKSKNKSHFASSLGISYLNGSVYRFINEVEIRYNLPIDHFDKRYLQRKYKKITKVCPVCKTKFETLNDPDEKTTCSVSCSNTFFRSGLNNGMFRSGNSGNQYRTILKIHHKMKCVVCGEERIVACHHYDFNHDNNDPNNLVPLCPTHHQYVHSKHYYLIKDDVDNYVKNFSGV